MDADSGGDSDAGTHQLSNALGVAPILTLATRPGAVDRIPVVLAMLMCTEIRVAIRASDTRANRDGQRMVNTHEWSQTRPTHSRTECHWLVVAEVRSEAAWMCGCLDGFDR